jgi:hypothetical protein
VGLAANDSRRRRVSIGCSLAILVAFYFWTATTSEWPGRPGKNLGYYNVQLANAFLAGQMHLLIPPSPALLALPDPYDPVQNQPYRLHDAVLFDGKYYLYYGPTPALVLFGPFRALTGLDFTEPLAVALFCSIGLVHAFLLVQFLCLRFLPRTPFAMVLAAIPALGFGNVAPFLLRRPLHYEVAISAGYAFVFAGLYYLTAGALGSRFRRAYVAVGSLLLGLAGGARFPMLGAGLVALALAGNAIARRRDRALSDHVLTCLAFFGPVSVCVGLLGLYNWLRFGSWTEFGISYTLQGGESARTYAFYNVARMPAGLLYYLLVPPRFLAQFPFIVLQPHYYRSPPPGYYLEPVAGILTHVPLVGILVLWPVWLKRWLPGGLGLVAGASLAVGLVLLGLFCLAAGTMRYEVDFATFLLVPALLLWCSAVNALGQTGVSRVLVVSSFSLLLAVTVVFNTAFSLVGYYDNLKSGSPQIYEAIHEAFRPLERWLASRR